MHIDESQDTMVVCKICEKRIKTTNLANHSKKCKVTAEYKARYLNIKTSLISLTNTAYTLRNQLTTNVAIQKLKYKNSNEFLPEGGTNLLGTSKVQNQKKNPIKNLIFLEDGDELSEDSNKSKDEKNDLLAHIEKLHSRLEIRRKSLQTQNLSKHDFLDELGRFARKGTKRNSAHKDLKAEDHEGLQMSNIDQEFNKAMLAFKKILAYGRSFRASLAELEDEDTSQDLNVKNEISILYSEIIDLKVSEYLKEFLDTIQIFISVKKKYFRMLDKLEALESSQGLESEPFSDWKQNTDSENSTRKRRMGKNVSMTDTLYTSSFEDDSESSSSRKKVEQNSKNHPKLKKSKTLKPEDSHQRTLSKFAVHRNFTENFQENSPSDSFLPNDDKNNELFKNPKLILSSKMESPIIKQSSNGKVIIKRLSPILHLSNESDEKSESTDGSNMSPVKGKVGVSISPSLFKNMKSQTQNNKKRKISLHKMRNFEDITKMLENNFPSLDEPSNDQSLAAFCSSKETIKKEEEKNNYFKRELKNCHSTTRGYFSDSAVDEKRKIETSKKSEIGIEDFEFIKMLGQGAYGKVYLVKKKSTGDKYAMKIVNIGDIEKNCNQIRNLKTENDVYASIKGEWVVKALYTFSYQNNICFVLEYMTGGDFVHILEQVGCFEQWVARFYFGELVLAVESLHLLDIIHRDLKPANLMLDAEGHLKLTDFGLSEKGVDKFRCTNIEKKSTTNYDTLPSPDLVKNKSTPCQAKDKRLLNVKGLTKDLSVDISFTRNKRNEEKVIFNFLDDECKHLHLKGWPCRKTHERAMTLAKKEVHRIVGTPDYMAPEIISGEDCNNKSVDIWSLGVILFELLVGIPPFNAASVEEIFENIQQLQIEWPPIGYGEDKLSPEAADLIQGLLNPNRYERLTISEIKCHKFFEGFDWANVRSIHPPIIPEKKEEIKLEASLKLQAVFTEKYSDGSISNKIRNKQAKIFDFDLKRVDFLHEMNQQIYDKLKLETKLKNNPK